MARKRRRLLSDVDGHGQVKGTAPKPEESVISSEEEHLVTSSPLMMMLMAYMCRLELTLKDMNVMEREISELLTSQEQILK